METYLTFITNALLAATPDTDLYYKQNERQILNTAIKINEKFPVTLGQVYRGILLKPDSAKDSILKPLEFIKYLSFTEDKEVALEFADTKSDLSLFVMRQHPDSKGYLIEHNVTLDEIVFHHSWIDALHLNLYFDHASINTLKQQKEVLIKQRMIPFKLKQV